MVTAFASGESETKFTGVIESLPATTGFIGDWKVAGITVHVTGATTIEESDGRVALGATVKVEGRTRADGSIEALQIEVKQSSSGSGSGGSGSGSGSSGSGSSGSGSGSSTEVKFFGSIDSFPPTPGFIGDWTISGRTVHVTSLTRIEQEDGPVAVGATVKVEGNKRPDNSIDAEEIEVKNAPAAPGAEPEFKLTGKIESLPPGAGFIGDWTVSGKIVHVSAITKIETEGGPIALGAMVEVEGALRPDGSIDARKIETKDNLAELKGAIELLPGTAGFIGDWTVSGRTVHVTAATILNQEHGPFVIGAMVEVKGTIRSDGSIDATRIEVQGSSSGSGGGSFVEGESATVKGLIESLPSGSLIGDWTVKGQLVHVVSSTKLKSEHGPFVVGAAVKVKGIRMADGSVVATKIQSRD
jgi:hypothetical protein